MYTHTQMVFIIPIQKKNCWLVRILIGDLLHVKGRETCEWTECVRWHEERFVSFRDNA